jgi:hypothetical protein
MPCGESLKGVNVIGLVMLVIPPHLRFDRGGRSFAEEYLIDIKRWRRLDAQSAWMDAWSGARIVSENKEG